jgi:D-3-phosphoglycerate dehydrogenase
MQVMSATDSCAEGQIRDVDAVVTRARGISRPLLQRAERLRVISHHGTGVERIDIAAASEMGIVVCNTPGMNTNAVAEHTLLLMLAAIRALPAADAAARRGDFSFKYGAALDELGGRVLGLVGYGAVARRVAQIAGRGFGMEILAWTRHRPAHDASDGVEFTDDLDGLVRRSDVVSLHVPSTADTMDLMDARRLALMRQGSIFINTARGGLVDEAALGNAIRQGRIGAAGLDVFAEEDAGLRSSPFAGLPNVVLTPHVGGISQAALRNCACLAASQVIDVLSGRKPPHLVNPAIWNRRRGADQ